MTLLYLLPGAVFGFILSRSGAADYDFIQAMFLFESFQLYGGAFDDRLQPRFGLPPLKPSIQRT